jgi:hypothetical protein
MIAESPAALFHRCLEHNIITADEAQNLTTLSNDLELYSFSEDPEIPEDVVHYGILMHGILKRLNAEN